MAVTYSDLEFTAPVAITDTSSNGGRMGHNVIIRGKNAHFPRVTAAERTSGLTRYRKMFVHNKNSAEDSMTNVLFYFKTPTNSQDRMYLGLGEQNDTQSDIGTTPPGWTGCGQLNTGLSGAETSVVVDMENDDFEFLPGSYIYLHNAVMTSQTIDDGSIVGRPEVKPGNSCQYISGSWRLIADSSSISYPYGIYIGDDAVLTENSFTEEFLEVETYLYEDEAIGTGDGSNTSPTLSTLSSIVNGLELQEDFKPVISVMCGGVTRYVYIDTDGTCSGYCSAGEIDPSDGSWTTDITWTTAPDNGESIIITYYDKSYSYSGNTVTIDLADSVSNAYTASNSYVSGCVSISEVTPSVEDWTETFAGSGAFDETTYPLLVFNDGTEYDENTLTFSDSTNFSVVGVYNGSYGNGDTGTDFEPSNPNGTNEFFILDKDGWAGTPQNGDTITWTTNASAAAIWWKEVVPVLADAEANNAIVLGIYWE